MKKTNKTSKKVGLGLLMVSAVTLGLGGATVANLGNKLSDGSFITNKARAEADEVASSQSASHETYKQQLYIKEDAQDIDQSSTYGYKWDSKTKTLTLSGFTCITGQSPALELPTGSTIYLEKGTENYITLTNEAISRGTPGANTLGNEGASAGIFIGDGSANSTATILGYGSLTVLAGHYAREIAATVLKDEGFSYIYGFRGNLVVGNLEDYPTVEISAADGDKEFTVNGKTYKTGTLATSKSCGFTLNSGSLHLRAGQATMSCVLFQPGPIIYKKGKIILEASEKSGQGYPVYSGTGITNSENNAITVRDKEGNDLKYDSGTYRTISGDKLVRYVIIDIAKQISFSSTTGIIQEGKQGKLDINYDTYDAVNGDQVSIEYYDPEQKKYSTTLPTGITSVIDQKSIVPDSSSSSTKGSGTVTLNTDGSTPEGTYKFRLAITTDEGNGNKTFYSEDFTLAVGFKVTNNEYDSGEYALEESENPTKTNEDITITAKDGYKVSSDGKTYADSVTYNEESNKTNPKTHASLFIKKTSGSEEEPVSVVEFDYSLDKSNPTAKFDNNSSYVAPDKETLTNQNVVLTLSDVEDGLSETSNISKEYVLLSSKYSEEELKKLDENKGITWSTIDYDEENDKGEVTIAGNNGETRIAYIKITDEAGNSTYFASKAYSFDSVAPTISNGLEDGGVYYTSTGFTIDDSTANVYYYKNGDTVNKVALHADEDGKYILPGNEEATYKVVVEDGAGNKTEVNVTTHTISSLADPIKELDTTNVKTTNLETIQNVQKTISEINTENATADENAALKAISNAAEGEEQGKCEKLIAKINEINSDYAEVEKINTDYQKDKITSSDLDDLKAIQNKASSLLSSTGNLTSEEQDAIQKDYDIVTSYISSLTNVQDTIKKIGEGIDGKTKENVTSLDKDNLQSLENDAATLLSGDNLTSDERTAVEGYQTTLKELLNQLAFVGNDIYSIGKYLEEVTLDKVTDDNSTKIEEHITTLTTRLNENNLTDDERKTVTEYKEKLEALQNKVNEVKDEISKIENTLKGKDKDSITSEDEQLITDTLEEINALLETDNITVVQRNHLLSYQSSAQELIDRISSVRSEIKSIDVAIEGKSVDTVKTTDRSSLEEVQEVANALIVSGNLTQEEKESLTAKNKTITELLNKISEIENSLEEIDEATKDKTTGNVTLDDKESLEEAQSTINNLLNSSNLTADQITSLETKNQTITSLLNKISDTEEEKTNLEDILNSFNMGSVAPSDKKAIEDAKANINEMLSSGNLTEEEKTELDSYIKKADSLLKEIAKDEAIAKINAESAKYSSDTVNSSNKDAINEVIDEINKTLIDYANELTDDEKASLNATKAGLNGYISIIDNVENSLKAIGESLNGKTTGNVKSSDKDALEALKGSAEELLGGTNITTEERTTLANQAKAIEDMLDKIGDVANKIESASDALKDLTVDNVTSADKKVIEDTKGTLNNLLSSDNLTESEKTSLNEYLAKAERLLGEIAKDEAIAKINAESAKYSSDTVNSSNKDAINEVIDEISKTLTDYANELTDDERASLNAIKTTLDGYVNKINEVSSKISSVNSSLDNLNESNVTSANKENIESSITTIDDLLSGTNLTEEERSALTAKKASAKKLLEKISEVNEEYKEAEDTLTSLENKEDPSEEELEKAIQNATALKESGNLTSEEVTALNSLIAKAQAKLDAIKSNVGNLWWLIITLGVVALIELLAIAIKKHKLNKKEKEKVVKTNAVALPLLYVIAYVTYPTSQIVACIVLGVAVIILAAILSLLCIDWDWWKNKKENKKK